MGWELHFLHLCAMLTPAFTFVAELSDKEIRHITLQLTGGSRIFYWPVMGIFELFQHEKNGKFLERLQTFRKSLSICGRAGNQVFMWFVTFWGCPEPIFSTRGQIWCENETFAEINLLHKIASNSETVWSWEKFRTIPESCWDWLSTCTGCAVITSTIWLIQGVL